MEAIPGMHKTGLGVIIPTPLYTSLLSLPGSIVVTTHFHLAEELTVWKKLFLVLGAFLMKGGNVRRKLWQQWCSHIDKVTGHQWKKWTFLTHLVNSNPQLMLYFLSSWVEGLPSTSSNHSLIYGRREAFDKGLHSVLWLSCLDPMVLNGKYHMWRKF